MRPVGGGVEGGAVGVEGVFEVLCFHVRHGGPDLVRWSVGKNDEGIDGRVKWKIEQIS